MVDIDKKLKEQFGTNTPFEVPENYFDEFSAKMMDKVEQEEVALDGDVITPWTKMKPYFYMAASFIALFFIARQVIPSHEEAHVVAEETNIIISDDYDVLYSQIDEYSLVEFAIEEDIPSLGMDDDE